MLLYIQKQIKLATSFFEAPLRCKHFKNSEGEIEKSKRNNEPHRIAFMKEAKDDEHAQMDKQLERSGAHVIAYKLLRISF
jgi:hypothetical protein